MCEDPAEAYPSYTYQDTAFFLCLDPAGLQPDGYQRPADTGDQPPAKRPKSEPIDIGDAPPPPPAAPGLRPSRATRRPTGRGPGPLGGIGGAALTGGPGR